MSIHSPAAILSGKALACLVAVLATGCAKPYLPPLVEPNASPPQEKRFDGALELLSRHSALHVLWIHGMCPHTKEDWAEPRVQALARRLGDAAPQTPDAKPIGSFVYRYELRYQDKPITLDMVVWSELIAERRAGLCFDSRPADNGVSHQACGDEAKYPHPRATINDMLKSDLMNACLADALIYVGADGRSVRDSIRPDVEAALASSPDGANPAVLLVSESLGSKVMFDVLQAIMGNTPESSKSKAQAALDNTRQLMMFANQIPILDLTGPARMHFEALEAPAGEDTGSGLLGFVGKLKASRGPQPEAAGIDRLKVIAFSDPNDVLSYKLPLDYFPPSWNTDVVNVLPSNDYVWFGVFENPLNAHRNYGKTDAVMDMFLCGDKPDAACLPRARR